MAKLVATRATCLRRSVGCVLVNRLGHVLATGYNGVAAGMLHCNEEATQILVTGERKIIYPKACPGARAASGTNLDGCEAIHAEQNALLQCRDVQLIDTAYVTAEPCVTCVKLLMNTSCRRIVAVSRYPHGPLSSDLWVRAGREFVTMDLCVS
jgi:dCMP deaminase